mmetsp:Transcript_46837/g.77772  ORF Transcript_46837/g.77772 Transcript_46837/m.77772 type:complete len:372 (+) Transcript_46837:206-1321(+)
MATTPLLISQKTLLLFAWVTMLPSVTECSSATFNKPGSLSPSQATIIKSPLRCKQRTFFSQKDFNIITRDRNRLPSAAGGLGSTIWNKLNVSLRRQIFQKHEKASVGSDIRDYKEALIRKATQGKGGYPGESSIGQNDAINNRRVIEENRDFKKEPASRRMIEGKHAQKLERKRKRLCEHGRLPTQCIECGGSAICKHGRLKYLCKDCEGSGLCEHGRQRPRCHECGGSNLCVIHKKQKAHCKICGGSAFCHHGRQRSQCKDCFGTSICQHGRIKYRCKSCGGRGICAHGRVRSKCKDCGGGSICRHGRQRSHCGACGGGSVCVHERIRSKCKECMGGSICVHRKQKFHCNDCRLASRNVTYRMRVQRARM